MVKIMNQLKKSKTGIKGFDLITRGGLPTGRPSLVCGQPGSGKTLMGIEFIVNGIKKFNEPGVIISFEERTEDLIDNVASLGWDLRKHMAEKMLVIDYVYIERTEIEETGYFNLDGLFIRIADAVKTTGAKRILIDTLESLFSGFSEEQILRAEIRRLFKWLKDKDLTAIITAESGSNTLTRYGLEEYLSDCVIFMDNRVKENISTRRMRLVKYRGTNHGTDEFPFLISSTGFSILPLTEISLDFEAPDERFTTGIVSLDEMLDGKGIYRGSAVLISGTAGSGKTSLALSILETACKRGEKVVFLSFEESRQQITRNMASLGIDLNRLINSGLFHIFNYRADAAGIEAHLINLIDFMESEKPSIIAIDPLSNLENYGITNETRSLLLRSLNYIQSRGITCIFTELVHHYTPESSPTGISSLMDFWILLQQKKTEAQRVKILSIMKARGMNHSGQIRELVMSENGLDLRDLPANT
jgi:circadian clock protein KaiC